MSFSLLYIIVIIVLFIVFCGMAKCFIDLLALLREQKNETERLETKMLSLGKDNQVEIDHSFFINLGIEITRMRKRLQQIELSNKKHLQKSLERLESELNERGYILISYEGKRYDDGMNIKASFIPSTELEKGVRIITRAIKPQINYKDSMIHSAEVEVSFGD